MDPLACRAMSGVATASEARSGSRKHRGRRLDRPRSWAQTARGGCGLSSFYLTLSVLLFGLPVIGHFGSRIIAANEIDPSADMWFLGWWPHAVLHGTNPFITHAMFYPDGYNLQWATSMPSAVVACPPR